MATTREQAMTALFNLLNGKVPGINTYSRRVTLPQACKSQSLPVLMMYERPEEIKNPGLATPAIRTWYVWLLVVFRNPSKVDPGASILNPILDGIEAALAPTGRDLSYQGAQTLGGLVQQCKIEGEIHKELGDTDPDGLGGAIVPLRIVVP